MTVLAPAQRSLVAVDEQAARGGREPTEGDIDADSVVRHPDHDNA